MITVKKGEGLSMIRDPNGYPYPEGEFQVKKSTYVNRRIKSRDLILIDKKVKKVNSIKKTEVNNDNT